MKRAEIVIGLAAVLGAVVIPAYSALSFYRWYSTHPEVPLWVAVLREGRLLAMLAILAVALLFGAKALLPHADGRRAG